MTSQLINEGLRPLDLKEMVHPIFEIDTYTSKMGEDRDVCVMSFQVKDRAPAKDLMEFIEKGYHYVLDADISSGENNLGEYSVFVELPRNQHLSEYIKDITYGVHKLTGIGEFKFKHRSDVEEYAVTEEVLKNIIPATPESYDGFMLNIKTEGIKRFFSKTLMDNLTLDGDIITIHKPFNKQIQLRMVKEGGVESILEDVTDTIVMDDAAMSEIFWLTKVLGDYNINKVGESFMFDNKGQAMLLQRI